MHVGLRIGLAAVGGMAAGADIGQLTVESNVASGSALTGAGVVTMGVFGAGVVRNPPTSSPGFGLLRVAVGGLWARLGVTHLLRSGSDAPAPIRYDPAKHLVELAPPPGTTAAPMPSWQQPVSDPLRPAS